MYSFNTHIFINFVRLDYHTSIAEILANLNMMAHKVLVREDAIKEKYRLAVQMSIQNANIVVSNAAKAAIINHFQKEFKPFQPHVAIFDEAAQSTLADLYSILSLNISRLFLIGD
jgi:superfamily I DNA and/or RNA helicase